MYLVIPVSWPYNVFHRTSVPFVCPHSAPSVDLNAVIGISSASELFSVMEKVLPFAERKRQATFPGLKNACFALAESLPACHIQDRYDRVQMTTC